MNVHFMVKDSKRFGDSGGWGYATRSLFAWRQQTQVRIRKIERFPKDDLVMAFALRGLESRKFLPTSSP